MDKLYTKVNSLIEGVYEDRKQYYYAKAYLRHMNDIKRLDTDSDFSAKYRFNHRKAILYVETMQLFRHWKGEKAGKLFIL